MGDKVLLTIGERHVLGKKVKKLRKEGYVPGVVYGNGIEATPIMAEGLMARKAWRDAGRRHPVELVYGDKRRLAMIKTADLDPVKHKLRHLSLHVIKQNEKVETEVPIKIIGEGETEAEKAGLVVLKTIEEAKIEALPGNLPDFLEIDGAIFKEPGDHATIADIKPVDGVVILSDPDQTVATVYEPSALQAANDKAAGDAELDEQPAEAEEGAENGTEEGQEGTEESKNGVDKKNSK